MAAKPLTFGKAVIEVIIIWCFGGLWATLPLLGWNRYE